LQDTKIEALVQRIQPHVDERHENRYPEGRWADVEFTLHDGRVLTSGDVHASGGPERPFDELDIVRKFGEFATPALGNARTEKLRDAILSLTDTDVPFSVVTEHLYEPV